MDNTRISVLMARTFMIFSYILRSWRTLFNRWFKLFTAECLLKWSPVKKARERPDQNVSSKRKRLRQNVDVVIPDRKKPKIRMYLPEKEHLYLLEDVVYNRMVQEGRMYFWFFCLLRCRKIDCELWRWAGRSWCTARKSGGSSQWMSLLRKMLLESICSVKYRSRMTRCEMNSL